MLLAGLVTLIIIASLGYSQSERKGGLIGHHVDASGNGKCEIGPGRNATRHHRRKCGRYRWRRVALLHPVGITHRARQHARNLPRQQRAAVA